ncbi:uncharacterized protein PITG_15523 [Phytophthora infestans T30-4]|uniref:Uncharacterized protein n=1 Tax=Phytophthora infestans (strain T30-4) TaxID=403677 RepID=D0NT85_PHYIT|nr:uncharacterized protein PITG_15523 [Phytophthora infestans T30-4]EEY64753.1 conserved hypothetical protein [Phytophthora infestans T30-4]|eukprot:XP_002897680.1 conserved hypothetical protein [Phytophthora infestans T30-4]
MSIPDYEGLLPTKFNSAAMGDIPALGIKYSLRMIVLGPSLSKNNNLYLFILKNAPRVFAHLTIIARNPHQELYDYLKDEMGKFIIFANPDLPPSVDQVRRAQLSLKKPELVIIDDYSNDKLAEKNLFSHYMTRQRHGKLAISKRDLAMVVKDFNIPGYDERSIVHYYNRAAERKGQILRCGSVRGELRYNFHSPIQTEV